MPDETITSQPPGNSAQASLELNSSLTTPHSAKPRRPRSAAFSTPSTASQFRRVPIRVSPTDQRRRAADGLWNTRRL